jgi:hypothetical protein
MSFNVMARGGIFMRTTCSFMSAAIDGVRTQLFICAAGVAQWCASCRLQSKSDKTEVIWFDSRANLAKFAAQDCSLQV